MPVCGDAAACRGGGRRVRAVLLHPDGGDGPVRPGGGDAVRREPGADGGGVAGGECAGVGSGVGVSCKDG